MADPTPPPRLGITYVPYLPPEQLRDLATAAETGGLDELWVWEDCFKQSGPASAAAALAWTSRIRVGIGLMPAPLRNVALTAMEIATLERLFPGRVIPGIGHGVQDWMAQAGARVASPLTLLREQALAIRRLLAGEEVSVDGRYVRLDRVALDWPPPEPPPLAIGAFGPKSIALAGELADVFLAAAAPTTEVLDATVSRLTAARRHARPESGGPELVVSQLLATGPDARARVDAESPKWGLPPGTGSAGDADTIVADIRRLAAHGATSVAVQPLPDESDLLGLVRFLGEEVRPRLGGT
jgi:5,10-methylenetetrahydromethanopterin reductase